MTEEGAVVIERSFAAPVELLWKLWTEPEHFAAWYGPPGARVVVAKMEVHVCGGRLVGVEVNTPDGPARMWFVGEYREVVPHERIVYTESMSDADGEALPPSATGTPDGHPTRTEVTVEFTDLGGRTRLVLTHVGIPADSPGAIGWAMALDKLAVHAGEQNTRQRAGQ
jgi:uncharacterized protein YndB with AHSA1/START domain